MMILLSFSRVAPTPTGLTLSGWGTGIALFGLLLFAAGFLAGFALGWPDAMKGPAAPAVFLRALHRFWSEKVLRRLVGWKAGGAGPAETTREDESVLRRDSARIGSRPASLRHFHRGVFREKGLTPLGHRRRSRARRKRGPKR